MTSSAADPAYVVGLDLGSTTVKAVAMDAGSGERLWQDYRRHGSRQLDGAYQVLSALLDVLPTGAETSLRLFVTGSGAAALRGLTGAGFVQEVNAVTLAVEHLHSGVGSVVELGGQDAKIIVYEPLPDGSTLAHCSMNDKCASGTGATIDKCLIKLGLDEREASGLAFAPDRLHKVAAKCGVFAETDVVNLLKAGIPSAEIFCSLLDAIVCQNLAVLARGSTLRSRVLLLGGPNAFLPALQQCWRWRLPQVWRERDHRPAALPLEELIAVPVDAQYHAAWGAAVYGRGEAPSVGRFSGLDALRRAVVGGVAGARPRSGPALVRDAAELAAFRARYPLPTFAPPALVPGRAVAATLGMDGGSTSSKAVLLDAAGEVIAKAYRLSQGNPLYDAQLLLDDLVRDLRQRGAAGLRITGFGVTGYAAGILDETLAADARVVETVAHVLSARHCCGEADVVCDIGGQDIKLLFLRDGAIADFRLSNQCSAGNGMLLQAMAAQFAIPLVDYAEHAFTARQAPLFSYGCAVFLDSDRVDFQKEGFEPAEILAGLCQVLPKNIWQYVAQVPRIAELGRRFVLQGGTQRNLAAVKAQVDYLERRVPGAEVRVHPHCGEAGAIGAAVEAARAVRRRGSSRFLGLATAAALRYRTRNDEQTRCRFCPNECARTFIEADRPDGGRSRYIAGFSCEKGTVESREAMQELVRQRQRRRSSHPDLCAYEARLAFRPTGTAAARPTPRGWRLRRATGPSSAILAQRRRLRIGLPRVLNAYSTAPLFRAYFEALQVPAANLVLSPCSSEELFTAGARYGAIDPCYPAKVVQAHIHHLLHETPGGPPGVIFFPAITHLPAFVSGGLEATACPVVAGTPAVIRAAFTRERDRFAAAGVDYLDASLCLTEPDYFKRQMFEIWGPRLRAGRAESDAAVDAAWAAQERFDQEMQRRGIAVLQDLEANDELGLLLLGRPYHLDPGMHHGIPEALQDLGYPVLTIRSLPKDGERLRRWFGDAGDPRDIAAVWPEAYSTNSMHKVWGALFAARHPNLAVVDLSSFKCGHDAPTYGIIDGILRAAGKPRLNLHDLDATKPSGSLQIRLQTYAHALGRYREGLRAGARARDELQRRIAQRRQELWQEWLEELGDSPSEDLYQEQLRAPVRVFGFSLADLQAGRLADRPDHDRTADLRPAPPEQSCNSCGGGACAGRSTAACGATP